MGRMVQWVELEGEKVVNWAREVKEVGTTRGSIVMPYLTLRATVGTNHKDKKLPSSMAAG